MPDDLLDKRSGHTQSVSRALSLLSKLAEESEGLNLFGCAFSVRQRKLPLNDLAIFTGLSVLSDIMAETDRFESFN